MSLFELTTINLTIPEIVILCGVLITIGGNYWLLVHIGKEGPELKRRMKEVEIKAAIAETKIAEHKADHVVEMQRFSADIAEIKMDVKNLIKRQ